MKEEYVSYMLERLKELVAIDSTTCDYEEIQAYLTGKVTEMGYPVSPFHKGGFTSLIGGEGHPIIATVHGDDIGLMVHRILDEGTLKCHPVGGLKTYAAEHANVRVKTRDGRIYTGVMRRKYPSLHTMPSDAYFQNGVTYDELVCFLDEDVHSREDVLTLGIRPGDVIALDPDLRITEKGFIKSRFLDDKAAVAVMLTYLHALKEEGRVPGRKFTAHFSMYEEIGHGGCVGIAEDTEEFLSIDVGCVGPGQQSDEHKVTIIALDSRYPYNYPQTTKLVNTAEAAGVPHALDVHLPRYGTDGDCALTSGHDVMHTAFGPAVMGTHGYERTHVDSMKATFDLLNAYIG